MNIDALFGFTVDDIGYDGYSTEEHLRNILDFCDELKIKATFFAVPIVKGKRLDKRPEYISILKEAIANGHEVSQHGLTHDRFEVGIPPQMILDLPHEGPTREYLQKNRTSIEESHTVPKIRKTLATGREIIENAIGDKIVGFRSPALQSCPSMFVALEAEGYEYDSSVYMQEAGWDIINGIEFTPAEINKSVFKNARKTSYSLELPLTAEYTWYLGKQKRNSAYELALHDFKACAKAGIPFVNVSHVSPIQEGDDGNLGFDFYRNLISEARDESPGLNCTTLSEISKILAAKKPRLIN